MRTILRFVRKLGAGEGGQELAEFALILPVLLMMMFGVIEFGNAFSISHTMGSLSREGANLAARGTQVDSTVQIVMQNGTDIQLSANGGAIVTHVDVQNGNPIVTEQAVSSAAYAGKSRIGTIGNPAQNVGTWGLQNGQQIYTVEIFYQYQPLTPLRALINPAVPDTLYERTVF